MRFEMLGAVRAWRDGVEVELGPAQQRALLAVLMAYAGQPVSPASLIDLIWPDAPASAPTLIHRYVGNLRRAFEPGLAPRSPGRWLLRRSGGYQLVVDADSLDLLRFRSLADRARKLARDQPGADHTDAFTGALALWHGRCSDAIRVPGGTALFAAIDAEYTALLGEAARQALRSGGSARLIGFLRSAVARDVFDEGLQARLMLSLAAVGRPAEALDAYRTVRTRLATELGTDPGEELRDALRQVLAQQPGGGDVGDGNLEDAAVVPPAPVAQLPPDLPSFTGRRAELATMSRALEEPAANPNGLAMFAIDGLPGVGKTALAVHWAHQVKARFPDGQLYANLRGFDAGDFQVSAAQALSGFLIALGVRPDRVPPDLDAQSALYRGLLAGRRVLVVLDNARDTNQVRPLLPGSAGCAVVITSRGLLVDLLVREGVRPVNLGVPTPDQARELLAGRLGAARLDREPAAAAEIIDRCGRLPLALAVVAARAATNPAFSLAAISQAIAGTEPDLSAFGDGAVSAVFSWSYRILTAEAARVFRHLALARGPDIGVAAVGNLVGLDARAVRAPLAELIRSRLVTEASPDRFVLHDLLRRYAAELGATVDPAADRERAVVRLAEWYARGAVAATAMLLPTYPPVQPGPVELSCPPPVFADYSEALAWCEAEQANVTAATVTAADRGLHNLAWRLPLAFYGFFSLRRPYPDWIHTYRLALHAVREDGAREAEGRVLGNLGNALMSHQDYDEAIACFEETRSLSVDLGDRRREAGALSSIGFARYLSGQRDGVVSTMLAALAIHEELGDRSTEAHTLNNLGLFHQEVGDFAAAEDCYRRALGFFRMRGERRDAANAIANLGAVRLRAGDPAAAVPVLEEAAGLLRELADDHELAAVLRDLAAAYDATGRERDARAARQQALEIATALDDHGAGPVTRPDQPAPSRGSQVTEGSAS